MGRFSLGKPHCAPSDPTIASIFQSSLHRRTAPALLGQQFPLEKLAIWFLFQLKFPNTVDFRSNELQGECYLTRKKRNLAVSERGGGGEGWGGRGMPWRMEDAEISKQWSYLSIYFKRAMTRVKMNEKQHHWDSIKTLFAMCNLRNVQLAQCATAPACNTDCKLRSSWFSNRVSHP